MSEPAARGTTPSVGETLREFGFECEDTLVSRWVCAAILQGRTYPYLPFLEDVQVVFDVGANCGAASVHFGRHLPDAQVHAFEPGSLQRAILERNVDDLPNVHVHPIGLHAQDQELPLYRGRGDSGMSSVHPSDWTTDEHEMVRLRDAGAWAAEHGIDRIDVLKVDAEGCEVDVLAALAPLLPTVQVLFVEYDSRRARRELDRLVEATHELYIGKMFLDQGEVTYLAADVADRPAATEWLRSIFSS